MPFGAVSGRIQGRRRLGQAEESWWRQGLTGSSLIESESVGKGVDRGERKEGGGREMREKRKEKEKGEREREREKNLSGSFGFFDTQLLFHFCFCIN